jgi:ADP-dependent NAD(P)H-hydrate dehydratase / NAD(P)H-hydrate epimerase
VASSVLSSVQMQQLERDAFADGVDQEDLMDEAGRGIGDRILCYELQPGTAIVYLGKGNNAGDAVVAASRLEEAGWDVWLRSVVPEEQLQGLVRKKLGELAESFVRVPEPLITIPAERPVILLDGLLGLGARKDLKPEFAALTREMNELRAHSSARTYAVDLPTGASDEGVDPGAVRADVTITVAFPKQALVRDDAPNAVGRLAIVDLPDLSRRPLPGPTNHIVSTADELRRVVPRRDYDTHKGTFGRVGLVAGSRGFVGAAILCAEAAARAGAGLISLFVPSDIYEIVAAKARPEIMVKPVADLRTVLDERLDALGVGPGVGISRRDEILDLIRGFTGPAVVDADGLNLLAHQLDLLDRCAGPRLLTPHPGEMARLINTEGMSRAEIGRAFTDRAPVTLLLKGARTLIAERDKPLAYNSTGLPALATGGSGDVLTGVCSAFLGQGIAPFDAARLGAWLCGRAAELAMHAHSEESMLPSDLFDYLGAAFQTMRDGW